MIAAFALAGAAFAQNSAETTLTPKELKAKKAADLKAFKAKQKAELAAFIEEQNNPKPAKQVLVCNEDTIAYILGAAQSNGLRNFISQQFGVDSAHVEMFANSVLDHISQGEPTPEAKAEQAGQQIASQIQSMCDRFSADYYAAEPDKKMNVEAVAQGVVDGLLGKSFMDSNRANNELRNIMDQRKLVNNEKLYGANRDAGVKFLEENKKNEGVVVLPSGLQYKVLTEGTGEKPTASDKVSVHYEGKLIDGTVFDSSYKRGEPTSFGVTQVIKGWTEALQLMPVGSKWMLYIPYELAYGDREAGKEIKPYSALTFTVELLDIVRPEAKAEDAGAKKADSTKLVTGGKKTTKKK